MLSSPPNKKRVHWVHRVHRVHWVHWVHWVMAIFSSASAWNWRDSVASASQLWESLAQSGKAAGNRSRSPPAQWNHYGSATTHQGPSQNFDLCWWLSHPNKVSIYISYQLGWIIPNPERSRKNWMREHQSMPMPQSLAFRLQMHAEHFQQKWTSKNHVVSRGITWYHVVMFKGGSHREMFFKRYQTCIIVEIQGIQPPYIWRFLAAPNCLCDPHTKALWEQQ